MGRPKGLHLLLIFFILLFSSENEYLSTCTQIKMLPFFFSFDCCSDEKDFVLITEWHGEKRRDVIIKRSVDSI